MKTKNKKQPSSNKLEKIMFICPKCGPFNRVIIEHWMKGDDGPSHLDLIHHVNYTPHLIEKIYIRKPSDGQLIAFAHCAECNTLLDTKTHHPVWGKNHAWKNQETVVKKS
jgi:hypothetical protein